MNELSQNLAFINTQNLEYYYYHVVFEEKKPVIYSSNFYEKNGVLYCATASENRGNRYSYCLNNPLKYKDPTGNFFVLDDYGIDKKGYITKLRETQDNFDRLIALNKKGKETNKSINVSDKTILPSLSNNGEKAADYDGNYAVTNNKGDAFEVFKFASENSAVEWGIDGYRTSSGPNEYVIRTSHNDRSASPSFTMSRFNEHNMIFSMHSHLDNATKGASYAEYGRSDMQNIIERYHRFESVGMKNISTWFNANGINTVFPKHYIYHTPTQTLYHYTPWKSDVYIRNVNSAMGLYYNLGF